MWRWDEILVAPGGNAGKKSTAARHLMDIKEAYRVLELGIGANRSAVDAAFFRQIERWHPDRAAAGGPEAIREAQRMVQAINEAYQTLVKIAPTATEPAPTQPAPAGPAETRPRRPVLPASPPAPSAQRPPPPPPPPPAPVSPATTASASAPALSKAEAVVTKIELPTAEPAADSDLLRQAIGYYDALFPLDTPRRRFGPVILVAGVVLILLLGKCTISSVFTQSPEQQKAAKAAIVAQTTGRLVVKSNRANTTVEVQLIPAPGAAAAAGITGSDGGAAEQTLSTLPLGKYILTARSAGWPDIRQEVTVDAGRTTETVLDFKSGSLRLDTVPSGVTVRQGTEVLGKTPLLIPQLPPGECLLSLEYPAWPIASLKTTITEGVESAQTVRLPHGKLTVDSTPPGAKVLQGKRTLGQTPLTLAAFPAGTRKLTLQAKDFPALEVTVSVEDGGDVKITPALAAGFPVLDPAALLRAVWVPDNPNKIAPPHEGITGPFQPKNEIVRNLNRKRLYENWLRQRYCHTATIKSYDRATGQIEFAEDKSELSKYRVLAQLTPEARNDPNLAATLVKGTTFAFYGRLSAVEEPRWPFKVITLEFSAVEPLR